MTKHKTIKVGMRPDLLDKLLFAFLSGDFQTRRTVCEKCNVSRVTASKVAKALIESKIMCEKTFAQGDTAPSAHLSVDDDLSIMIIDLSSPTFSLSLVSPDTRVRIETTHTYDASMTFDDNLNVFLSRCGLKAKQSGYPYSAITVIYADEARRGYLENVDVRATLPSIKDKRKIDESIYSVFHKHPISHLTVSQAIGEALRFGLTDGTTGNEGVSYIFIGSRISSFHIYPDGSVTVCSPQYILTEEENALVSRWQFMSKDELDSIFVHTAIFMSSAFSPSIILLESDLIHPDDVTAARLTRAFAIKGILPPIVRVKDRRSQLYLLGAIRSSVHSLAKRYVIP